MNKIYQNFDHSNCKKIMNHHKRENACLRFFWREYARCFYAGES